MSPTHALAMAAVSLLAISARAGLAPENVAVVVNGDSSASLRVANEYAKLRDIPRRNLVVLHHLSSIETTGVDRFRTEILNPVLQTLRQRGLDSQIDCITYSVDIPYMIELSKDVHGRRLPQVFTQTASINGLTYLYEKVFRGDIDYMRLDSNLYARKPIPPNGFEEVKVQPSVSFRHSIAWDSDGRPNSVGPHYMLSTVLGVDTGRGNTTAEVLASLRRSVDADFSRPSGTIYIEMNNDVRSKAREWGFYAAADELRTLGVRADVETGKIPENRDDVAGAVIGAENFHWSEAKNRILPGAICEHLTSYGGKLTKGTGQTPCTDFIKFGASGTSGTVTEPYAVQAKFPTPFIQVQYVKGFTLAESFYQSVMGPYQLLIIGDPLCKPWAKRALIRVDGLPKATALRGIVRLKPRLSTSTPVSQYELYIDGKMVASAKPGASLNCNTEHQTVGPHRLSVLARCADVTGSVYRAAFDIHFLAKTR